MTTMDSAVANLRATQERLAELVRLVAASEERTQQLRDEWSATYSEFTEARRDVLEGASPGSCDTNWILPPPSQPDLAGKYSRA